MRISNSKNFVLLLFLISLQQLIKAEVEPESIKIGDSKELNINGDKYLVLDYTDEELANKNYVLIRAKSSIYNSPGLLYISFTEKNPSPDKRDYSSQSLEKNEIIINVSKLKGKTKLYINIHTLKETQIQFNVISSTAINLELDDDKKKFKLYDVSLVNYTPTADVLTKKIMFYSVGERIGYFTMNVIFKQDSDQSSKEYTPKQKFDNGYGIIIDLNEIKTSGHFEISLLPNKDYPDIDAGEKKVLVGFDITENADSLTKLVDLMEHEYGYISTGQNCYKILGLDVNKDVSILVNVYSQALTFGLYNDTEEIYSLDVFHNGYLKLEPEFLNKSTLFCFKKFTKKEEEEEILGEISYDFQVYYDDELSSLQSFLFPLADGKTYTNSLKKDEIMIYRHNSFTKNNLLYSASMTVLRGKPVLYGYQCDTYPDCNLDINKLNLKN